MPPSRTRSPLLVLYLGSEQAVAEAVSRAETAPTVAANPYWNANGVTIEDPDGFRIVLVATPWHSQT
jgi:hypothetical protein